MELIVKKLDSRATLPRKGSDFAAGYDLYALEEVMLNPGEQKLYKTGISMAIPTGYYGRIAPRSGLAYRYSINVHAGVIDSDYRGDIGVILINHSKNLCVITVGTAIAQIIIEACYSPNVRVLEDDEDLPESVRNTGGYGSTDKQNRFEPSTKKTKINNFEFPVTTNDVLANIINT